MSIISAKNLFGTDGIRGAAGREPLTAELALKVGMACGSIFMRSGHLNRVIIGKDTRLSCYMLESALTAGLSAMGMEVILVGPLPTPAVSMLTKAMRADLGIMISASHNLYQDNGIKIFSPDGMKLSSALEEKISALVQQPSSVAMASGDKIGMVKRLDSAAGRYLEHVKATFPRHLTLEGVKVVIDCANGAAYHLGKAILQELGAEVIAIGDKPNGMNINEGCGSTAPELLQRTVLETKSHLGIALDGDGDRVLIVDEKGQVVAGDQLIAMLAVYLQGLGQLKNNAVAITQMSNLALEEYLSGNGIKSYRCNVGDKHVMALMMQKDLIFGGEASGHLIFADHGATGDGLVAALTLLALYCTKKEPISKLASELKLYPQTLIAVPLPDAAILESAEWQLYMDQVTSSKQADQVRILVRPSGTEPVLRILVEGPREAVNKDMAAKIASFIGDN